MNWDKLLKNERETVVIFDDHQNALERIKQTKSFGIKHLIFDDNYAPGNGDCYSVKKILSGKGHPKNHNFVYKVRKVLWTLIYTKSLKAVRIAIRDLKGVLPNERDRKTILNIIEKYYDFPPLFPNLNPEKEIAKWQRKESILKETDKDNFIDFDNEAEKLTGICYVCLK